MSHAKRFIRRFANLLRREGADRQLSRELESHLLLMQDDFERRGMRPEEARLAARRAFGGVEQAKEQQRDARSFVWVEDARRDVGYAVRTLVRAPGFTLTAILSLALGIGANAAIFSLVDAVLLRAIPVVEPHRLVEIGRVNGGALSYPMYEAIRAQNDVLAGAFCLSAGRYAASARLGAIDAGDVYISPVSGDYFSVLGISPIVGRALNDGDLAAADTMVIGYDFWQRAFAGDPGVVGQALRLGSRTHTIVGIAPPGFRGIATGQPMDVWVPLTYVDPQRLKNPSALTFRVIARRQAGVPIEQVGANMSVLARQMSALWGFERPMQLEVTSASSGLTALRRRFSRPLVVLMTVVGLLLLIATANVANLLLARASVRQREIGVRLSLGASRSRLIRQLLTESAILGTTGGLLGLLAAPSAAAFLVRFLSSAIGPMTLSFAIDARMLAFAIAATSLTVLVFGLAPALAATRLDLTSILKGRAENRGGAPVRPGRVVVVTQVAVSCVLLVVALLFGRSLMTLTRMDPGFRAENVLLFGVRTEGPRMSGEERVRLYERLRQRFAGLPGVRSAAFSSEILFGNSTWTEPLSAPGFNPSPGQEREAVLLVVSPEFFRTMDTTLLRGRDFDRQDDERSSKVAIVNEATVRYFFGDGDAVGRTFRIGFGESSPPITVVGVVKDAKYRSLKDAAPRIVYLPFLQMAGPLATANFAVKTITESEAMADALWKQASAESSVLRLGNTTTQSRLVEGTIAQDRMLAQLSAAFGAAAVALVCLGLYGLTAYDVSRRTREIGLQMALGAQRSKVIRSVVGGSVKLVAAGIVVGLVVSVVLSQMVESLLFGVQATDWRPLAGTAALLIVIGAAAAYWPARRASRLDPMCALRTE
jgi:predicted permease